MYKIAIFLNLFLFSFTCIWCCVLQPSTLHNQQSSNIEISKKKTFTKSVAPTVDSGSHSDHPPPSDVGPSAHLPPVTTRDRGMQVTPNPSMIEVRANMLHAIEDENKQLKQAYYDQLLRQEEESLKIRLQYEKKRQERSKR